VSNGWNVPGTIPTDEQTGPVMGDIIGNCGLASYTGGDPADKDCGVIQMKNAWMDLTDASVAERAKYHIEELLVYTPAYRTSTTPQAATCELRTMGLVGQHINHKTLTQPAWVYSTFEHVDNAPDCTGPSSTGGSQAGTPSDLCPATVQKDWNCDRRLPRRHTGHELVRPLQRYAQQQRPDGHMHVGWRRMDWHGLHQAGRLNDRPTKRVQRGYGAMVPRPRPGRRQGILEAVPPGPGKRGRDKGGLHLLRALEQSLSRRHRCGGLQLQPGRFARRQCCDPRAAVEGSGGRAGHGVDRLPSCRSTGGFGLPALIRL